MAANSQFGLPGSMFISAVFSSLISSWRARRFSRFSLSRSTSFTTYDLRPAALFDIAGGCGGCVGAAASDIRLFPNWQLISQLDRFSNASKIHIYTFCLVACGGTFSASCPLLMVVDVAIFETRLPSRGWKLFFINKGNNFAKMPCQQRKPSTMSSFTFNTRFEEL